MPELSSGREHRHDADPPAVEGGGATAARQTGRRARPSDPHFEASRRNAVRRRTTETEARADEEAPFPGRGLLQRQPAENAAGTNGQAAAGVAIRHGRIFDSVRIWQVLRGVLEKRAAQRIRLSASLPCSTAAQRRLRGSGRLRRLRLRRQIRSSARSAILRPVCRRVFASDDVVAFVGPIPTLRPALKPTQIFRLLELPFSVSGLIGTTLISIIIHFEMARCTGLNLNCFSVESTSMPLALLHW